MGSEMCIRDRLLCVVLPQCVSKHRLSYTPGSPSTPHLFLLRWIISTGVPVSRSVLHFSVSGDLTSHLRGISRVLYCSCTAVRVASRMASPTSDDFSGREWKNGDAHEILPNIFLGSMVRVARLRCLDSCSQAACSQVHPMIHVCVSCLGACRCAGDTGTYLSLYRSYLLAVRDSFAPLGSESVVGRVRSPLPCV